MQKNRQNASILLWSIFISMILSILFLSISTKITKNLKNNDDIIENSQIHEIIKKQIAIKDFSTIKLKDKEYLLFESIDPLIRNIKEKKELNILFNSWNTINLKVEKIYWADIYYETYQWIDQNNITTLVSSWILSDEINKNLLDNSNNWWKIYLKNLGWESKIKVYSEKSCLPKYINYKIVKVIWNKQLIKEKNKQKLW